MIDNTNKSSKLGIEIRLAEVDPDKSDENIVIYEHYTYCKSIESAIKVLQQLYNDEQARKEK